MNLAPDNQSLLSEFVSLLGKDNSLEITKGGSYNVKVNAEIINARNVDKYLNEWAREEIYLEYRSFLFSFSSSHTFLESFKREVKQYLLNRQRDGYLSAGFQSFDFNPLTIFASIDKDNVIVFINTDTRELVPVSYKNYEKFVPKNMQKQPIFGVISFDPYSPERMKKTIRSGQSVDQINTYHPPVWQFPKQLNAAEISKYARLPHQIENFFRILFPIKESRDFVYDWLHFALVKRCETYLVLNGAKGIGKGIFTDRICRKLMGERNWKQAPQSALDSNFNAMLLETRMIVIDEMSINDNDKIAKLKKYINQDQAIELKGVDVGETVTTYNSFIISSNNLTDLRIEWDDRRFSVMDITDALLETIESTEIMRNFGYWLMYRTPRGNEFTVYKGSHFWKLCYTSLPEWSKCVVDEISTGTYDTIDDETLKSKHRDRGSKFPFPHAVKVEDFIKSYRHENKGSLGVLEKTDNGGWIITVSDSFYKSRDNTGIKWVEPEELL